MPLDSNGIWTFEEADSGATMSDLLNLGQDATSARVAALQGDIDAREPLLGDTKWIPCIINAGYAAHSSFPLEVRQLGQRIYLRGGFTSTGFSSGSSHDVGYVPPGFEPPVRSGASASAFGMFWSPTVAGMGAVRVFGDGLVEFRTTNASVPSSLLVQDGMSWFTT